MQSNVAVLNGKRFLLSDIAQDLPVLDDTHVPTLARMLNELQLLSDLCEVMQILFCSIHSAKLYNRTIYFAN